MEQSLERDQDTLDEWTGYVNRMEHFFRVNGVDKEDVKLYSFLALIGPFLYMKLKFVLSPTSSPEDKSYEDLVDQLVLRSLSPPPQTMQRFLFYTRNRSPDESLESYILQLKLLCSFCDFKDSLESTLKDRFICGVGNQRVQLRLLEKSDLTLNEAMEIATEMEAILKKEHYKGDSVHSNGTSTVMTDSQENSDINNVGTTPLPPSAPPPIPPYVPTERTPSAYLTIVSSLAEDDSPPPSLPPQCLPKEVASCTTESTPLDQPNDTTSSSLNSRKVSASGITTATNVAYFTMDILKESPLSSDAPCETSPTIDQCSTPSQKNSTDKEEQEVPKFSENNEKLFQNKELSPTGTESLSQVPSEVLRTMAGYLPLSLSSDSEESLSKSQPKVSNSVYCADVSYAVTNTPTHDFEQSCDSIICDSSISSPHNISPQHQGVIRTEDGSHGSQIVPGQGEQNKKVIHQLYKNKDSTSQDSLLKALLLSNSNEGKQFTPDHSRITSSINMRTPVGWVNINNLTKKSASKITSLLHKLNKEEKRKYTNNSQEDLSAALDTSIETEMHAELLTDKYRFPGHLGYGVRILKKPAGQRKAPAHWKTPSISQMIDAALKVRANKLYFDVAL